MSTIYRMPKGQWRAQVRRKGRYVPGLTQILDHFSGGRPAKASATDEVQTAQMDLYMMMRTVLDQSKERISEMTGIMRQMRTMADEVSGTLEPVGTAGPAPAQVRSRTA